MKKLLVLALLGLVLGAGIWKSQNPDGTVNDVRVQAVNLADRLKAGVLTVRDASATARNDTATATTRTDAVQDSTALSSLEERLALIEKSMTVPDPIARSESAQATDADSTTAPASTHSTLDGLSLSVTDALASAEANVVRIDAIDSRLELLVRRLDEQGVERSLGDIKESVDSFGALVTEMRRNNALLETTLSNEVADAAEKANAIGLRLDTLAAGNVLAAGDDLAQNGDDEAALNSLSATLDQRLEALESRLSTVNSDTRQIAALNEQLEAANTRITQLQQENATTRRSLSRVTGSLDRLETAGESISIDTVQTEIRDQLALLQSQIETSVASNNAGALQDLLETTRTRVEELEARVQDLPAASSEADNAQGIQTALESQIVSLERRMKDISDADPEIARTLSGVRKNVDQLTSRGFVTQEDLRTRREQRAVQYKIYFDRNSVEITDEAATVLDSFIAQEKNRTSGVSIFGFTDRLGSATYNQQLALQRATNVRSYLIQNGLDYTTIKALSGLGEDAAAAVLPDNAGDAQQRVVVLFAAQP